MKCSVCNGNNKDAPCPHDLYELPNGRLRKQETRAIKIPVYRDSDGKPVCGDCQLKVDSYTGLICVYDDTAAGWWDDVHPHKKCPLWQGEV